MHCQGMVLGEIARAGRPRLCLACSVPALGPSAGLGDLVWSEVPLSLPTWKCDRDSDLPGSTQMPTVGHCSTKL